jgi:hypothetical protein
MAETYTCMTHTGGGELSAATLRDRHICYPTHAVFTDLMLPPVADCIIDGKGMCATFKNYSPDGQGNVNVAPYEGDIIDMAFSPRELTVGQAITLQAVPAEGTTPAYWAIVGRA